MFIVFEVFVVLSKVLFSILETWFHFFVKKKQKNVVNEICLITGAGSGIGRQLAIEFSRRRAIVVLWDINDEGNQETARIIEENGGKAYTDYCDVTNRNNVREAAQRLRNLTSTSVTILVNNAGILYGKSLLDLTEKEIETTFKVNAMSHFWTLKEFLPDMIESDYGHIVSIASIAGLVGGSLCPDYDATKHAVVGLDIALRQEIAKRNCRNIKTSLVCPALVETGLYKGTKLRFPFICPNLSTEETVDAIVDGVLTNKTFICIPKTITFSNMLMKMLPDKAYMEIFKFIGGLRVGDDFTPTREYQVKAHQKKI